MATVRMSPVTLTESRSTCDPSGPGWDWITVAAGIGVTGGASGSTLASSRVTPPVLAAPAVSSCVGFSFAVHRSEEHTSELQSLMRISYAVFCLKKNTRIYILDHITCVDMLLSNLSHIRSSHHVRSYQL